MISQHTPVLLEEVLAELKPDEGSCLLDLTIGQGGHAAAWLKEAGDKARVVGFDTDKLALAKARTVLSPWRDQVTLIEDNFWQLQDSLTGGGILLNFSHVLFDLGIGSHQLADPSRGFSFQASANLNMRFGESKTLPPAKLEFLNTLEKNLGYLPDVPDLLQRLSAEQLAEILRTYGEERYARRISAALLQAPLPDHSQELVERVVQAVPASYRHGRINPATRTFQALRLAVNRELETLQFALPQALAVLSTGGKIAIISFHSLEDRLVKHFFRRESADCICPPEQPQCNCAHTSQLEIVTKKPIQASAEEIADNPRARSAKMRVARKIS